MIRFDESYIKKDINIRTFTGEICVLKKGKWFLSESFRTFLEKVLTEARGRKAIVNVEFINNEEIIIKFSTQYLSKEVTRNDR